MEGDQERGSAKVFDRLFSGGEVSTEELGKAVSAAKAAPGSLKIERWWWRGQPAIDQIFATLLVERIDAGRVVEGLLDAHSAKVQVGLEVFPFGIPDPRLVQIQVTLGHNVKNVNIGG